MISIRRGVTTPRVSRRGFQKPHLVEINVLLLDAGLLEHFAVYHQTTSAVSKPKAPTHSPLATAPPVTHGMAYTGATPITLGVTPTWEVVTCFAKMGKPNSSAFFLFMSTTIAPPSVT